MSFGNCPTEPRMLSHCGFGWSPAASTQPVSIGTSMPAAVSSPASSKAGPISSSPITMITCGLNWRILDTTVMLRESRGSVALPYPKLFESNPAARRDRSASTREAWYVGVPECRIATRGNSAASGPPLCAARDVTCRPLVAHVCFVDHPSEQHSLFLDRLSNAPARWTLEYLFSAASECLVSSVISLVVSSEVRGWPSSVLINLAPSSRFGSASQYTNASGRRSLLSARAVFL